MNAAAPSTDHARSPRRGPFAALTPPRLLLAPPVLVVAFVAACGLCELAALGVRLEYVPAGESAAPVWQVMYRLVVCGAAVLYGLTRASRFNPMTNAKYAEWLAQTPWSPSAPLPLGPVHLVLRDVLPLAVLALLAGLRAGLHPALPLVMAGLAYIVILLPSLAHRSSSPAAWAVGFGLPALLLVPGGLPALLGVTAALYAVAALGVGRLMRAFPWDRGERRPTGLPAEHSLRTARLGWPITPLAPRPVAPSRTAQRWATALLVGWWLYAVLSRFEFPATPEERALFLPDVMRASLLPGGFLAVARALWYVLGHAPPISLAGRIATGRWILPRYDYFLLAPLGVLATAAAAPLALFHAGAPIDLTIAASIALSLAATVTLPPGYNRWRLTGAHRLFQTGDTSGTKELVKAG